MKLFMILLIFLTWNFATARPTLEKIVQTYMDDPSADVSQITIDYGRRNVLGVYFQSPYNIYPLVKFKHKGSSYQCRIDPNYENDIFKNNETGEYGVHLFNIYECESSSGNPTHFQFRNAEAFFSGVMFSRDGKSFRRITEEEDHDLLFPKYSQD